jgi:hypothetical protein
MAQWDYPPARNEQQHVVAFRNILADISLTKKIVPHLNRYRCHTAAPCNRLAAVNGEAGT